MTSQTQNRFANLTGWALCAIAWALPFVVIYAFARPMTGQAYFFQTAACLAGLFAGAGLLFNVWRPSFRFSPPLWLALGNLAAMALAVARSREPGYSLRLALLPACAAGFCALLIMQPGRDRVLRRMGLGLCAAGALLAAYGALQHFGIEFLPYSDRVEKNRVIATIGHPNYLGSVLGPLVFVLAGLILGHPRRALAWVAPLAVLLMLFTLAVARTRAIWLGLSAGFVIFTLSGIRYCRAQRTGMRRLLMLAGGGFCQLIGVAAVLIFVIPHISNLNLREKLGSNMEIKSRVFYWDTAIQLGSQRPALGQGYGMFDAKFWETAQERFKSPEGRYYHDILPSIAGVMPGHVHNEFLETFCEEGWTGLTLLLGLLLYLVWFGYRALLTLPDSSRAFEMLGVWTALIVSSIDALFGFPWRLPVSLMVLAFLAARLYDMLYPQSAVGDGAGEGGAGQAGSPVAAA